MKRCSLPLLIRKMQIKAAVRYHLTQVRMATINKTTNNKRWWGCGERGTLAHCWWDCKLVQLLWKTVWSFLQNKNETAFWPSNPTSGNVPGETQNTNSKEYVHLNVHCSIIYNSQDLEAAQVPINRWIDKEGVIHVYNGILLSYKKTIKSYHLQHVWT